MTCIGDNAFYPCPSLTNVSSAKGLVKVSGGWRTEEEQERITKDRAQQEEAQRRQEAKQTELVAKQAAYDEAQVAKGLVKVNGKWFRKVVCSSCRGKECGYVYTRAAWIDSGPYAAPVYIPPARGRGQCSACGGTGYVLQEATE